MKPARVRSQLLAALLVIAASLAWHYLAPTQIGGSTSYVITGGVSMEPRFHSGDLAIVRPAGQYRVGDVVAYYSPLLRVVVLHRIIGRDGARYVVKGDHNNFVDPTRPDRGELLGKLWLEVPAGGLVLRWIHTPLNAALLVLGVGSVLLLGAREDRRRRRRRRRASASGRPAELPMKTREPTARRHISASALLIGSSVACLFFVGLGCVAFTRPAARATSVQVPYTQEVRFSYRAVAPAGAVYPSGALSTGDPIFLALVHRMSFGVSYRLSTAATHRLTGSQRVLARLTGPTGWSRSIWLGPLKRFSGDHASQRVTLDLSYLESLIAQVQRQTGIAAGSGYSLELSPVVTVRGQLAGQALHTEFGPALRFELTPLQLAPGVGTPGVGESQRELAPRQSGSVATAGSSSTRLDVLGDPISVATLRWIAVLGLLISGLALLLAALRKRSEPSEETARIQILYGHLMVPIVASTGLAATPVDVRSIAALVRLAESGQRLILHSSDQAGDSYLLNEEGTVYRYRVESTKVVWGDWSSSPPRPIVDLAPVQAPPSGADTGGAVSAGAPASAVGSSRPPSRRTLRRTGRAALGGLILRSVYAAVIRAAQR